MAKKNIRTQSKIKKAQAMIQAKQYEQACELYEKICAIDKRDADAWSTLGSLYGTLGRHEQALEALRKSIELRPNNARAQYNFGIALREQGRLAEAQAVFKKAFSLEPKNAEIGDSLAHACLGLGQQDEAIGIFQKLLLIRPNHPETLVNLGSVYQAQGRLGEAIDCYHKAQAIKPGIGFENLGAALSSQGKYDEALVCLRSGLKSAPANQKAFSNILLTLNYVPDTRPADILAEHRQWQAQYGKNIKIRTHANTCEPERRLRIGYVSPDMRSHSVANFFEPLLAEHSPEAVEVFCYSSVPHPDAVTEKLQSLSHHWRDISRLRDQEIVSRIRNDRIDILVDLAGHTSGNHLSVFLHKPAPVQVTWLGYPNTTGLDTIDYRFTDALADPEGQDAFHTEKLYRLPDCFLCYQGLESSPDVSPLPALDNGHVTFGSFNNLAKM
ncbi:MAG TPA: tetratricopeptide repeat protein, partial [Chromatiales bacterium]|nr:tetratricopeptide repeat protein [Chromatiales bacterium]